MRHSVSLSVLCCVLLVTACATKPTPQKIAATADAQRRAGDARAAADTLRPWVKDQTAQTMAPDVFMAYMRLLLEQGYNIDAEQRLQQRIKTTNKPSPQLYNLLGVALAGQGKTTAAEDAFKRALVGWDGRKGVVEQNLMKLRER